MKNILSYYILFVGAWLFINGVLHDIFVLKKHPIFDKELIHLLIDGHILIFGGIFYFLAFAGIRGLEDWGYYLGILASIFILGYCGLILKILPSTVTILLNLIALIVLVINLINLKSQLL